MAAGGRSSNTYEGTTNGEVVAALVSRVVFSALAVDVTILRQSLTDQVRGDDAALFLLLGVAGKKGHVIAIHLRR